MRDLLYLTHRIPYPPNKGDKIRAYHVLRYLQRHFRVHLGSFIDDPADLAHAGHLAAECASTCFVRLHPRLARLASIPALWRGEALSVAYYRHPQLRDWVAATLKRHRIDSALVFSGPMAQYLPARTARGPLHRVLDLVDVDSEKWQHYADDRPWPLSSLYRREGRSLLEFERAAARSFDQTLLVSRAEAELFRLRAPESGHKTGYFSNGVDCQYFSPQPGAPDLYLGARVLVFTGAMDYWPNIDAVCWLARRVMPTLRQEFPDLQFHIVGARPAAAVTALARQPGIHVSGTVPDIRPYLQHAALAVAPLQIARGIQNKVLEAMAMGKTVVATPQALEGLTAVPGRDLLCATGAVEFIQHIGRQLRTENSLGAAARQHVLRDYQWHSNLERLGVVLYVTEPERHSAEPMP
ncbi:TIGR03087 family PEP-CTERM/XrtA system glycosyltransferase [Duganella violaceipulchra]|uniref:Sugar transferase (PEP-CTERM/EpsH1 system associated) n=1 Tax=Duganella violaceipulchra TaxID=2849652 RepID=A0AA41H7B8_9BURK|nr:TIGR03087 family PEP-CTERM/XrtA system glycosyltransferase [Duganella violaceicalia]MBV6321854.1 TIGR03087 family PEP-CTERM/XrtA system glycosyltransferase [Duganella violaceicalia]MCP2007152.1 sugar transferase (PEP-CTERM/EpsH1 system associated) [Duganella violaceicalia]